MEPKGSYNNIPPIPHSRSTGAASLQGPRNQSYGQRRQQQQQQQQQWHRHSSDGILLELTTAQRLSRESSNHDPNSNSNPNSNSETHSNFSSENNKAANFNTEIISDTLSRGSSYLEPPAKLGGPVQYGSRAESETLGASQREASGTISDEEARVIHINDPDRTNDNYEYAGNTVRTSKYTVLTFIPRNLFEQFHRIAYIYFLILIVLNQLPWLAVFSSATSALPLAFVLLVTAFKDGYEDWRRHRSDKRENSRTALVWENGSFQPKEWKNIKVGEVIKVQANETLPCDIVLLSTSDPSGVAYVQTINLDGESNLKIRYAKQETASRMHGEGDGIVAGIIRCEKPNRNIYKFHGNIELDRKKSSLGSANIVLRGCELKNTAWIIGVVIYAGQETKVMLNSSGAPSKRSRLEAYMNRETLYLAGFLTVLCATMGIGMGLWLGRHKDELDTSPYYRKRYYDYDDKKEKNHQYYGIAPEVIIAMLTGVIIFQIMIPISLYISMELVRIGQAFFMIRDRKMYDSQSKSKFQCRALNINEDLGQIGYVFSDKTGTLTENKMEFRNASVCGRNYGPSNFRTAEPVSDEEHAIPEFTCSIEGKYLKLKMEVPVDPDLLQILNQQKDTEESRFFRDYFLSLAACNTIVPIIHETGGGVGIIEYQGESPDEQALAYAAASYGYVLTERSTGHIIIYVQGKKQRFDILGLHEFDSERKRMSVIVRSPDKSLKLLVKGADSSMLSAVDRSVSEGSSNYLVSATESHLYDYSSQGLRTLVMGYRDLTIAEFESWRRKYEEANNALIGRARRIHEIANSMECNLTLLGASGIEDKLQHGVPETIEALRKSGIKVWVLTGDKQETAISIAISCKLIVPSMQQIIINGKNREDCHRKLQEAKSKYGITRAEGEISVLKKWKNMKFCFGDRVDSVPMSGMAVGTPMTDEHPSNKSTDREQLPLALIIDGTSLVHILESDLEDELYDITIQCRVVLCCRVAPMQKAGIVALIKKRTSDVTLAIGDGANDVSMIQMADVGVGISGQEGRQAVMASDFAMGQFRFLEQLLLVHGHWNYDRMSYMILYNFYRNAIYVFVAFWYVLHTAFTATTAVTDWSGVLYSVIYTALPTIIVAIMDQDLEQKTLIQNPKVYNYGQAEKGYNAYLFWLTMLDTVWQSLVIAYVGYFSYRHSTVDIWSMGSLWTIAVVLIVNLHLAMDVQSWTFITHIVIWASILFTWICLLVIDSIPVLPNYGVFYHVVTWGSYWLNLIIAVCLALLPRLLVKFVKQTFWPSDIQILREKEVLNKKLERSTLELNQINECT